MDIVTEKTKYRDSLLKTGVELVPVSYRGVCKERISYVLEKLALLKPDIRDSVYALLSDNESWHEHAAKNDYLFCDGASCAQIGIHVKMFQRRLDGKVDREHVRKKCMIPLFEIGAVDKVLYEPKLFRFVDGHPKHNNKYTSYKLSDAFQTMLTVPHDELDALLLAWSGSDKRVERRAFQGELISEAKLSGKTEHSMLIRAIYEHYAPRFLPGFDLVYIDNGSGKRETPEETAVLSKAGVFFIRSDRIPDLLFWNPNTDSLWVVDAISTDGEVDYSRQQDFIKFAKRNGKTKIGFTTAYTTWKKAAKRQGEAQNLAENSYLWIHEDASKNILISQSEELGKLVDVI